MRRWKCVLWALSLSGSALHLAVIGSALIAGGCATSQAQDHAEQQVRGPDPRLAPAQATKLDLEEDGLPAQLAPPRRAQPLPDDPSEPWSPNYGGPSRIRPVGTDEPSVDSPPPAPKAKPRSRALAYSQPYMRFLSADAHTAD